MSLLQLSNIVKTFPDGEEEITVLDKLNFSIEKGESVAIIGSSGVGKSTLLHIMSGISRPTDGEIFFDDKLIDHNDENEMAKYRNSKVGIVLQDFGLIEYRSVLDNVSIPLIFNPEISQKQLRSICKNALDKVGLPFLNRETWKLSGGEKQRVAIARAIVNNPEILFADEPTGSLDPRNKEKVLEIFKELNRAGMSIVIVTHDMEVADSCDKVYCLENGKIKCYTDMYGRKRC